MSVNTKTARVPLMKQLVEDLRVSEEMHFAQYTLVDEVPGLLFGLMTVVYIVSSLWSLA